MSRAERPPIQDMTGLAGPHSGEPLNRRSQVAALARLVLTCVAMLMGPVAAAPQAPAPRPAALHAGQPTKADLAPPSIAAIAAQVGLPEDAVGVVVAPVRPRHPGERHLGHGVERALQPASTIKLMTTLVGLERLGADWRGRTRLLAAGPVVDGVLQGDWVLEGGADMDLDAAALEALLRQARERGVREIRGDLLLDRSLFNPTRLDVGVPPFDEAPEFAYNLIPDALTVDSNLLRVDVSVDAAGTVQARQPLPLPGVQVTSEMAVIEGACGAAGSVWKIPEVRDRGSGRVEVVLRGAWPRGCERSLALNVLERDLYIERLVRAQWAALGGRWEGRARESVAPGGSTVLAERFSRPLGELVHTINKTSNNPMTRTLLLSLGRQLTGADRALDTRAQGQRAVRDWFQQRGIPHEGLVVDNGSGLSRSERITPAQLEAVIRAGLSSRWAAEFLASLPVLGVDGFKRWRRPDGTVPVSARLKPGGLRNVVSAAGTVDDADGQPTIVVVIVNHDRAASLARPILDAVIEWVARSRFGATAKDKPARP